MHGHKPCPRVLGIITAWTPVRYLSGFDEAESRLLTQPRAATESKTHESTEHKTVSKATATSVHSNANKTQ